MSKIIDITGQRFGSLVALEKDNSRHSSNTYWWFQCDCGKKVSILGKNVRNGITQSCGCSKIRDWTNQRIGLLTVLEKTDLRKDGAVIWKCQCDCGNIKYVSSDNLRRKDILSCGCKKISYGENQIKLLLDKYNVSYETEKEFETCRFIDTHFYARFDFYINNQYLIEYDGKHHFSSIDYFGGQYAFNKQKEHDLYKNQWCKENNIPLIRIPYQHLSNLQIEDLLLETSTFII